MRRHIIHIVGASGAGTSALGRALEREHGYKWIDTDDCYWLPTDPPFIRARPCEERIGLLSEAIERHAKCAVSGSLCGWGDIFIPRFHLVVFVDTPADIRVERLREREYRQFGERIRAGGDMYENHTDFLEWAESYDTAGTDKRSRALHEEWFKLLKCPLLRADGTKPVDKLLEEIIKSAGASDSNGSQKYGK